MNEQEKFWKELDEKNRLSRNFCKKCWQNHKEIQFKMLAKINKAGYDLIRKEKINEMSDKVEDAK